MLHVPRPPIRSSENVSLSLVNISDRDGGGPSDGTTRSDGTSRSDLDGQGVAVGALVIEAGENSSDAAVGFGPQSEAGTSKLLADKSVRSNVTLPNRTLGTDSRSARIETASLAEPAAVSNASGTMSETRNSNGSETASASAK
eukprot:6208966-Pleurochrysis_carterae.AAC.1